MLIKLSYVIGIISGLVILIAATQKFKKHRFTPFLSMGFGLFLTGISFLIDILFRFKEPDEYDLVFLGLRISVLFFYTGSLIALFSFFSVQPKIAWGRLLVYSTFFGMMIQLHLGSDYYVFYNIENGMWFTHFIDLEWMYVLHFLTSLPIIDLFLYIIKRHRLGFSSKSARIAVTIFWFGLLFPITILFYPFSNEFIEVAFTNLSFTLGLLCFGIAFLKEPLVFSLSRVKFLEVIIANPDQGDIAVAQYSWFHNDTFELKSQALSAIDSLLNELIRENLDDVYPIKSIDFGRKKLVIERSDNFVCYTLVSQEDITVHFALKKLLHEFEKKFGNNEIFPQTVLDQNLFLPILRNALSFAIRQNKVNM